MRKPNFFATLIFFILFGCILLADYLITGGILISATGQIMVVAGFIVAFAVSYSIQIADQWEKTIVLRLGKFHSLRGPGLFFVIPVIDSVPFWIDT
ncbi:MAG: slipin family protein, partial [Pseudobdellovibrio sp.]